MYELTVAIGQVVTWWVTILLCLLILYAYRGGGS